MTRHIVRLDRSELKRWRDTLEQERREVLKSVLESIANESIANDAIGNSHPDPDRTAARMYLIRHLATPVRPAPVHPATPTAVAPPLYAHRSEARCR
jgi:hypothetical protein